MIVMGIDRRGIVRSIHDLRNTKTLSMNLNPFLIERHFAKYEFEAPFQLSCSDCEPLSMVELLDMASPEMIGIWQNLRFAYTESAGHPMLRYEISKLYEGIRPEEILVCVPEEGIFLAMNALLAAGDHVVVISPAYQSLHEIAVAAGCSVTRWNAGSDGRYEAEKLTSLVNDQTRMVVINFPHNPTGTTVGKRELEKIALFCEERGLILFSDEMYRGLEREHVERLPGAASLGDRCISLSGMSKSWSLPGLRIGWLVCRNAQIREKLMRLKDYSTICSSAPSEILSIMALQNGPAILSRNAAIIAHNIGLVNEMVGRHPDRLIWRPPLAGSVALMGLPEGESASGFCDRLLLEKGVLAIGSHLFGMKTPSIRLGLGMTGFGEALRRLDELL